MADLAEEVPLLMAFEAFRSRLIDPHWRHAGARLVCARDLAQFGFTDGLHLRFGAAAAGQRDGDKRDQR